jgi:hypothetical protein
LVKDSLSSTHLAAGVSVSAMVAVAKENYSTDEGCVILVNNSLAQPLKTVSG